ncbi:hypothetical protein N7474_009958 [Penicillium riverlandense]|uniref:uncharacterized protein n=1 Tax=Penicillium riverlandense TaxID=1903569 RepID=UPI0025476C2C|nr:uncharacterized protein N7474_009958 [Penicillium riverlandense]KAJ5808689.1 hypothetical protein N7474_009958 [Penicillium riverlandense]
MYHTSQLGTLILGIISLTTTFSYGAPSASLSRIDQYQFLNLPRVPFLNGEEDDRAIYGGPPDSISDDLNVFDKRKSPAGTFWAEAVGNGWNIKKTGHSKFKKDKYVGKLTRSGHKLGEGGQGTVIDGTRREFAEPTTDPAKGESCGDDPVEISEGDQGYDYALLLNPVDSEYVVKPQMWAKTITRGNVESIVAFEELTENAQELLDRGGQLDFPSMLRALFGGAIAAKKKGLFNMDIKLKNLMTKEDLGPKTIWKIIDWDMMVYHDPQKQRNGYMGSYGYMPPVVWDIGMTLLYAQGIGKYEGKVTLEMKQLAKKIYTNKGKTPPNSTNEKWMWIALLSALSENKSVLEVEKDILPTQLHRGNSFSRYRSWYAKVLCKEADRYNLQEAWDALVALNVGLG